MQRTEKKQKQTNKSRRAQGLGLKRRMTRVLALTLAAALSAAGLMGCSSAQKESAAGTEAAAEAASSEAADSAAKESSSTADAKDAEQESAAGQSGSEAAKGAENGTVTVTDMAGRTVTLPSEIKSIATFGSIGVINAFVELMGDGDKIVNEMTANFTKSDKWAMQYVFAPQIKGAPVLQGPDGEIRMEEVLKLNPDLCLVMSKDLIEPLESNGLKVVYFEWKQTDDVKKAVKLMGEALGKQDVAEDYLKYFDDMVAEAGEKTKQLTEEQKKKVLYGNIDQLTQPHVIAEWWITTAGGISVTKDAWDEKGNKCVYTQEDLLSWNPDVMLTTDASMKDKLMQEPLYADLAAIQNEAIYNVPTVAHVWGNRTVEQPLTVFWTMHKLYPELESKEDLKEKISYFYSHFFRTELSDAQIDTIIGE